MAPDARENEIDEIAERGTIDDLPRLVHHLPLGSSEHRVSALRALEALLTRSGPEGLLAIESRLRSQLRSWGAWSMMTPSKVEWSPPTIQRLATFHYDGHVRERAVSLLASRMKRQRALRRLASRARYRRPTDFARLERALSDATDFPADTRRAVAAQFRVAREFR